MAKKRKQRNVDPVPPTIEECDLARATLTMVIPFLAPSHPSSHSSTIRLNLINDLLVGFTAHLKGTPSKRFKAYDPN